MDSKRDQFSKNVFQRPNTEFLSDDVVDAEFETMTQSADMDELRQLPGGEITPLHPISVAIRQIGNELIEVRIQHEQEVIETKLSTRILKALGIRQLLNILFTNGPVTPKNSVDRESNAGVKQFPVDSDVTSVHFFFHPDADSHKWYYQQVSTVPAKNFTNSYTMVDTGIEKSASYFDEPLGRVVNVSVMIDDVEAENLLIAAQNYYAEATGKIYVKSPAPRLKFPSKADHDLAA